MSVFQGSKLCDFYNMLDIARISFSKRSVVWCGAFTLMLIYSEKQMDIGFLADKMASALDSAVRYFQYIEAQPVQVTKPF